MGDHCQIFIKHITKMEFFTILLSSLLTIISPAGLVVDSTAESAIRSRLDKVEQLQVRVDNAPSYQLLQGKVQRLRVAGRGLWSIPGLRIEALELETDPIAVDLERLGTGDHTSIQKPLQAGVRLVLIKEDINQALRSPLVSEKLRQLASSFLPPAIVQKYQFLNPQVEFLGNNRLRFQVELVEANAQPLLLTIESGVSILTGRQLQLVQPVVAVNGQPLPPQLVAALTSGISNKFDLRTLEETGIIARILKLKVDNDRLELASFLRVEIPNQISVPSQQKNEK